MKKLVLAGALASVTFAASASANPAIDSMTNQRNVDSAVAALVVWTAKCALTLFTDCSAVPTGGRS